MATPRIPKGMGVKSCNGNAKRSRSSFYLHKQELIRKSVVKKDTLSLRMSAASAVCYHDAMFPISLKADQWSAVGTVVSAFVAALNLIVVIILVQYNKKTLGILTTQSKAANSQAAVAVQTLLQLNEGRMAERGRQYMRVAARLEDLNDRFLIIKHDVNAAYFSAQGQCPFKSDDWHTINAAALELWPEGVEPLAHLDHKLREIDMDMTLLSRPVNFQQAEEGVAHLKLLLANGHQTLMEARSGFDKHVVGEMRSIEPLI